MKESGSTLVVFRPGETATAGCSCPASERIPNNDAAIPPWLFPLWVPAIGHGLVTSLVSAVVVLAFESVVFSISYSLPLLFRPSSFRPSIRPFCHHLDPVLNLGLISTSVLGIWLHSTSNQFVLYHPSPYPTPCKTAMRARTISRESSPLLLPLV